MSFNFVVDRIVNGRAYPALAVHPAEPYTEAWQDFVNHWPYTVPCELIEHCEDHAYPYQLHLITDAYPAAGSVYPVGIGFFDFNIDYFALMSDLVHQALNAERLKIMFYYHEGDNPFLIRERLDALVNAWQLPKNCYIFISGNTAVKHIPGFIYFPDHELLYWRRSQQQPAVAFDLSARERDFTLLSRTHKWWRATVVADLHRNGLLSNSYWSYNNQITIQDHWQDNPIELDRLNLEYCVNEFLKKAPYTCDELNSEQHNDHAQVVVEHYANSRCNIILETHYDADQSGGAFLTEKTFKAIKHGQPFVMVGTVASLNTLRALGYRTFDSVIDNTYDNVKDNTQRWRLIFKEIVRIKQADPVAWLKKCQLDCEHNQQLFLASKWDRLNTLCNYLPYM